MAKFVVTYWQTQKVTREIEAESEAEAEDKMQKILDSGEVESSDDESGFITRKEITTEKRA